MENYSTEPAVAGQEHRPNDECSHPNYLYGICVCCCEQQPDVAVKSSSPVNELTTPSIQQLGLITENKTRNKKLCLVLDLDHTLLNTTSVSKLTPDEIEYLTPRSLDPYDIQENPNYNNNGVLYKFSDQRMTKLRPFVHTFLEETSRLFDLYVFTLGDRKYAETMTYLLDPKSEYFGENRVFSREDCVKALQKDLNVVKGVEQSECIIVDNLKMVWNPNCRDRLIQIKEYNYFNSSSTLNPKKSMCQRKTDESERNGWLVIILEILREVHAIYFDDLDANNKDIRKILNSTIQRKRLLRALGIASLEVV